MSEILRAEYIFGGAILASNLLIVVVNIRLQSMLHRIYLSGLLTGRAYADQDGWHPDGRRR